MLNLKKLRLKLYSDEPVKLQLEAKGDKVVTAGDISKDAQAEIINKDLVIATLTDKQAKLSMEITVEKGLGYVPVEQHNKKEKMEIGNIAIDASFSPVLNVSFLIENVRVGEMTNYEKLTMDILTDGTIDGQTAVNEAAKILANHFSVLIKAEEPKAEVTAEEAPVEKVVKKRATKTAKKTK